MKAARNYKKLYDNIARKLSIQMMPRVKKIIFNKRKNMSELWYDFKETNRCAVGVSEKEKREGQKKLFEEKMAEIFPNLMKI